MENFNIFKPILEGANKYGRHCYVLGKRGDLTTMYNETNQWYGSAQRTNGEVLVYDKSTNSLDWKSVYKNTKGFYFKKNGNFYLEF